MKNKNLKNFIWKNKTSPLKKPRKSLSIQPFGSAVWLFIFSRPVLAVWVRLFLISEFCLEQNDLKAVSISF